MLHNLLIGLCIGLFTGMPLGPIGAMGLRLTISRGRLYGIAAALGSCTADCLFAAAAALGLTFISGFLVDYQLYFKLFSGVLMVCFGFHIFFSTHSKEEAKADSRSPLRTFSSTFAIALANPATVFSFLVLFTSSGITLSLVTIAEKLSLVLGVFSGGAFWWTILILSTSQLHDRLTTHTINMLNKAVGVFIVGFGLTLLIGLTNYRNVESSGFLNTKLFEILSRLRIGRNL